MRYLRKKSGGQIYPYTEILSRRSDMVECNVDGSLGPDTEEVVLVTKIEEPVMQPFQGVVDAITGKETAPVEVGDPVIEFLDEKPEGGPMVSEDAGMTIGKPKVEMSDEAKSADMHATATMARLSQMRFADIKLEMRERFKHVLKAGTPKAQAIEIYIQLDRKAQG